MASVQLMHRIIVKTDASIAPKSRPMPLLHRLKIRRIYCIGAIEASKFGHERCLDCIEVETDASIASDSIGESTGATASMQSKHRLRFRHRCREPLHRCAPVLAGAVTFADDYS
jgi:hypothetical protein